MRGVIGDPKIMERVLTTIPMGRIAKASEVADFIVYLLSDKSSYITGNVSRVDGAWLAGPRT
jgi:NAD(P)-dependent dehydrogenase (short-subunit alcohol dehydrogenase family)